MRGVSKLQVRYFYKQSRFWYRKELSAVRTEIEVCYGQRIKLQQCRVVSFYSDF